MKYKEVRNPTWADAEHTVINCEIDFDDLVEEFVEFTASPNDTHPHGIEIYQKCIAGEFGEIAEYVEPVISSEEKALRIRMQREGFFMKLDQLVSNPFRWGDLTDEQQQEVVAYRQALLDITNQDSFPESVVWPETPSALL
jgi:hypothetical protein